MRRGIWDSGAGRGAGASAYQCERKLAHVPWASWPAVCAVPESAAGELRSPGQVGDLSPLRLLLLLLFLSAALHAQNAAIERGSQLYRTHCAVPYCHGPEGTAGRAPQLIGHSQSVNSMFKVISWGIPGTGMPEFTTRLKTEEIADLVAYAMTLRGASPAPAPVALPRTPSPDAKAGRALFFDAGRVGSCGGCHELDGWGVPAGPDIAAAPSERLADLRHVPQSRVRTARPFGGEAGFPALPVENTAARVRVYDLTGPLPVLRTFAPGQVALNPNTSWQHAQATRSYTDAELDGIGRYLRWLLQDR